MSIYDALYRIIDESPEVCTNIKRFRGILLDLSMDDTASVNLIELAMKQGLHVRVSKLARNNQREIQNLITDFVKSFSINQSRIPWLTEFFTNIFAERDLVSKDERGTKLKFSKQGKYLLLDKQDLPLPVKNYVPCGSGKQDYGFYLEGLKEEDMCVHPRAGVYATIFGILQRNLNMKPSLFIKEYEKKNKTKLNYSMVYRLEMMILLMIKNNYIKEDVVSLKYEGNIEDINAALEEINHLGEMLSALAKIEYKKLKYKFASSGIFLSSREEDGIIAYKNATKRETECRYIWNERNLLYSIDKTNNKYLDILLEELFDFKSFLPGQKEALIDILNKKDEREICIMPTGSGKSLIYYFVAMLNPCPTFVIVPTEILILDQIRNLNLFHGIDDVLHLTSNMNYADFVPSNKFIFITPMTFMNRKLINRLIGLNNKQIIGSVVLDEVHCISNWSHDFRPEYLMLSFNLTEFVDKTKYIGFTATANYSVIKDVKEQLDIDEKNIICPISLKNTAMNFSYTECGNIEDIYTQIGKEISAAVSDSVETLKRTVVFTRTAKEGQKIYDGLDESIRENVDVFNNSTSSYVDFAEGETDVLIADDTMGIGINMPSITNIIHMGAPISKSEYVQEMGRAGRNGIKSSSSIVYLSKKEYKDDYKRLIDRNVKIDNILSLLNRADLEDEFKAVIGKIFGNVEDKMSFTRKVITVSESIQKMDLQGVLAFNVKNVHDYQEVSKIMRYLYVLHKTGIIYSWYFEGINEKEGIVSFYIDQGKEKTNLDRVKCSSLNYINSLGIYKKATHQIKDAGSIEDVIIAYVEWHYSQLLYYHREQFIDMLDFLDVYKDRPDEEKRDALESYFALSILDVQRDVKKMDNLTIEEIIRFAESSPTLAIADNMRKSNEGKYMVKIDLFLLLYNLFQFDDFDKSRYKRIISNLSKEDLNDFIDCIYLFYSRLKDEDKLNIIDGLVPVIKVGDLLDIIYKETTKDTVYYYIFALYANRAFGEK
ncbi:MAG: DEAD/DEAH box helicase [Clostridia bacterium]|nr:DEAD/DEAH box helicase [Clostridia bacterium]